MGPRFISAEGGTYRGGPLALVKLQWGRASSARKAASKHAELRETSASMGPRFTSAEGHIVNNVHNKSTAASMGPRFISAEGDPATGFTVQFTGASMGPRFISAEGLTTCGRSGCRRIGFNGAALHQRG